MSKFELIKEYPTSPSLGHIVEEYVDKGLKNYYKSVSEDEYCNSLQMYHIDDLTSYPEFWKKLKESNK